MPSVEMEGCDIPVACRIALGLLVGSVGTPWATPLPIAAISALTTVLQRSSRYDSSNCRTNIIEYRISLAWGMSLGWSFIASIAWTTRKPSECKSNII